MDTKRNSIPVDSLLQLRQRLILLPRKIPERARQVQAVAELYGMSSNTVYRALHAFNKPHAVHRADHGKPRKLPKAEPERYCDLVAALKLRTTNKNNRHLSTGKVERPFRTVEEEQETLYHFHRPETEQQANERL